MTCEPAAKDWRMVAVVAEPEEKARAYFACSRAATAAWKLSLYEVRYMRHVHMDDPMDLYRESCMHASRCSR